MAISSNNYVNGKWNKLLFSILSLRGKEKKMKNKKM